MTTSDSSFGTVIGAAFAVNDLVALEEMLVAVATICDALGATLWQAYVEGPEGPKSIDTEHPEVLPKETKLFVAAYGFKDRKIVCAVHDLTLASASGSALLEGDYECMDCATDAKAAPDTAFYKSVKPGSLFAVRVRFVDNSLGVLTLYRSERGGFSQDVKGRARQLAQHLPAFYSTILDRVSYKLVESVSDKLDRAEETPADGRVLQEICHLIARALHCEEVSLFLEDRLVLPEVFVIQAATTEEFLRKEQYVAAEPGFTPFVLKDKKPLRVLDVLHVTDSLRAKTGWNDSMGMAQRVFKAFGWQPPVSFVAIPILVGLKLIGVMRCEIRLRTPHYFSEGDVNLLNIIAPRIGSFWSRQIRQKETEFTTRSWETFVDEVNRLEIHVRNISTKSRRIRLNRPFLEEIFQQVLEALSKAVVGADFVEIALVDDDGIFIESAAGRPKGRIRSLKLPLLPETDNSWAHVYHERKLCFIADTSRPEIPYKALYPDVKQALFVPMLADERCIGVLSLRSESFFRDPEKSKRMASLAVLEVALYYQLATVLSQQAQAYQDLEHQLRTPVFQALKRTRSLLSRDPSPHIDLLAANGLLVKTRRVLGNMRLYEELALGKAVTLERAKTGMDLVLKILNEAAYDNEVLWKHRSVKFNLDRDSFAKLRVSEIEVDLSLLEQVMSNLLDNAGKYGEQSRDVLISGSLDDEKKNLVITVRTQGGLEVTRAEKEKLGDRGYRSAAAKRRTAEGSGIGLYIVKQILTAHKGRLEVTETDPLGYTRISAILPL